MVLVCVMAAASVAALAQAGAAVWVDVPFVHQPREGCGAASLSMLMQYWAHQEGQPPSPDSEVGKIQQTLYVAAEHGIPASSMQSYLQQHGFLAFALNGHWSDLEQQLRKGRPLIVGLRPQGERALHYVVIDGIDPGRSLVTMNDPADRKLLSEERAAFEKDWSATDHWLLLAVPAPSAH
ncbi:MAG TPA: C39 family peptidase [Acidobacteriaceae bacterium]|jgi:ABC-type bacteriocin/lantibiotic exporter with double-glycine peptidase domain|nr:C39 family peptidase [Acidobacteriaceae bacterium]